MAVHATEGRVQAVAMVTFAWGGKAAGVAIAERLPMVGLCVVFVLLCLCVAKSRKKIPWVAN